MTDLTPSQQAAAVRAARNHHLPLLDLTADEVAALGALARDLLPGAGWVTPALRSALDKLTTILIDPNR